VTVDRLRERLAGRGDVALGGPVVAQQQTADQVSEDIARAELLALPLLFALSLVVFRGLVAALLPVAVALAAIAGALLVLRPVAELTTVSVFALNVVTALGLALAVDYALLVVTRFREELARGRTVEEALATTLATAGRTVLFSAATVVLALAGLLLFPQRYLVSMGLGGMAVTVTAAAASLLLLPALLAALGPRVDALAPRRLRHRPVADVAAGRWYRLARAVGRRPVAVGATVALALALVALPVLDARFSGQDASPLPDGSSSRTVAGTVAAQFPAVSAEPIVLAVEAPADARAAVAAVARQVAAVPGVRRVGEPVPAGDGLWRLEALPAAPALSDAAQDTLARVRALPGELPLRATGETARFVDTQRGISERLPLVLGLLAVTTVAVLFRLTGSVAIPLLTLALNVLTVAATLGLLVVGFQDGRLEGLLGFTSPGGLDLGNTVLVAVMAFALSTDYGIFLLSRLKEVRDGGVAVQDVVPLGLQRTGRIITAAALLLAVAIGAFVTSEFIWVQQIGLGIALAVLLDATLVRGLLVPAALAALGERAWWAPRPLRRLHARFGLSEHGPVRPATG